MNDLYVSTADADAEAVMRQVLQRQEAVGMRKISCLVERHTGRDPGMIKDGPDLVRFKKGAFRHVLLLWDHHGSGREKESVMVVERDMARRLDDLTWKEHHLAVAVAPELEDWLWCCPEALQRFLAISQEEMRSWEDEFARKQGKSLQQARQEKPKEMFEHLVYKKERRKPRPNDFGRIAQYASLEKWQASSSFKAIVERLRQWFPDSG